MANFRTLSIQDARRFLADEGRRRTGPHQMKNRILHWLYCTQCGLVNLKNDTTARALKAQCVWVED